MNAAKMVLPHSTRDKNVIKAYVKQWDTTIYGGCIGSKRQAKLYNIKSPIPKYGLTGDRHKNIRQVPSVSSGHTT